MIAVVSTSYQEADILDSWIAHLLAEDVDLILVADKLGNDNSRSILDHWSRTTSRVEWIDDTESCHRQAYWTDRLACEAASRGADWILPADTDEFPYAVSGDTIGNAMKDCEYYKLFMRVWPHKDHDNRFVNPHRLPKVAYRWSSDAHVVMGSHDVSLPGGEYDVLNMRELQYRSFGHFVRKAADRNATLEPSARARGDGWHHLRLETASIDELKNEWQLIQAQESVYDPIPAH